jgi:hypothetical protein
MKNVGTGIKQKPSVQQGAAIPTEPLLMLMAFQMIVCRARAQKF